MEEGRVPKKRGRYAAEDEGTDPFETLPNELLSYLFFSILTPTDLLHLPAVCRRWRDLLRGEDSVGPWRASCRRRWSAALWSDRRLMRMASLEDTSSAHELSADANALAWQKIYAKLDSIEKQKVDRLLLVEFRTNRILTISPDGSDKRELGPRSHSACTQFSPRGDKVIWVEIAGRLLPNIYVYIADTHGRKPPIKRNVDFVPFFAYFAPCGTRVALMGNDNKRGTIKLIIMDLLSNPSQPATLLDYGRPFFLSWSQDKLSMVVKRNIVQLERVELDPETCRVTSQLPLPLTGKVGRFSTPIWVGTTEEGMDTFMYAARDSSCTPKGQKLVVAGLELIKEEERPLRRSQGSASQAEEVSPKAAMQELTTVISLEEDTFQSFIATKDRTKVAYVKKQDGSLYVARVKRMRLHRRETRRQQEDKINIHSAILLAYFWSPNGRYLLLILVDMPQPQYYLKWRVWDSEAKAMIELSHSNFSPSEMFLRSYLPFFEQCSQVLTFFSPESDAFVYCGNSPADLSVQWGVWVQEIKPNTPPRLVTSDCTFAVWSPQ